ncbi:MAG: response regulator [Alphaproteobacteria bacterium]|nr:response regulator [Alphaproteobacteria bacterium]MBL6939364.1 response regulator [Alphaproteobacteria bacterium]MBL7097155.1 response regulator [Alphaproteobacteria bacterium]
MSNPVNVLLVDDQQSKLLSYEVMLRGLDVNIITATSASAALGVLLKNDIAVVLIDVCMPELDGFELAAMIRNHPRYLETALIFVSAINISETDHLRGYDAGAVDYVSVPVIPQILRAKVKVFADLYRKTRQLAELNRDLEERVAERTAALKGSTQELLQSEQRRSLALAAAQMGSWECDVANKRWNWDEGQARIFGSDTPAKEFSLASLKPLIHPDDYQPLINLVNSMTPDSATRQVEVRIVRPTGEERVCFVVAAATFDMEGRLTQIGGVTLDITDRKLNEQRQELLAREVDHRARNALAVVQSIVRLTKAESIATYTKAVEGRVQALAHVHDLLSQARWQGADIGRLIADEMAPYSAGDTACLLLRGPSVLVDANRAQTISLALHELATNAAKYGALSEPTGKVSIAWHIEKGALRIAWHESGGPPVTPPARSGFGSKIINASVASQRGGNATFDWKPEGLRCDLTIPLISAEGITSMKPANGAAPAARTEPCNLRILILEDEPLIGMATSDLIEELGHSVVGPFFNIAATRDALAGELDAAILDVNLGHDEAYPIAEVLADRGIPFIFMTGYGPESLDKRFRKYPVLQKPVVRETLAEAIERFSRVLTAM